MRNTQASNTGMLCAKKPQAANAITPTSAHFSALMSKRRSSLSASWPLVAENSKNGKMNSAPITKPAKSAGSHATCSW